MNRWARRFDCCRLCQSTELPHMAKGFCQRCYMAVYVANNGERVKAHKHEWYVRNGGKEYSKLQREQRHYSGLRDAVLARDGHRCVVCGATTQLVVHHKDGQGRGTSHPNNNMDNLETRCRPCHIGVHRPQLKLGQGYASLSGWAPKYGLDCCLRCKRSDVKHNAQGLCANCYSKMRKKK